MHIHDLGIEDILRTKLTQANEHDNLCGDQATHLELLFLIGGNIQGGADLIQKPVLLVSTDHPVTPALVESRRQGLLKGRSIGGIDSFR
ncbi:hypothetical protein ES705_47262 [subsurface metagenome]